MLQFDEMSTENKIKIYNKYATYYPNILKKYPKKFLRHSQILKLEKHLSQKLSIPHHLKMK